MMVIEAVSGPITQSWSLTGGKRDCSVGPGVGSGLTTVQPAEVPEASVPAAAGSVDGGDDSTDGWVAAKASVVAEGAGSVLAGAFPWHAPSSKAIRMAGMRKRFKRISPVSQIVVKSPNYTLAKDSTSSAPS
jgi:hypothetical protein